MAEFKVGDLVRVLPHAVIDSGVVVGDVGEVEDAWASGYGQGYTVMTTDGRSGEFYEHELEPYVAPAPITAAVDSVNHPAHYTRFPVEVIEITEQLDFARGNAVKYLCRAGFKPGVDELEDLSKAAWYVARAIEKLTGERAAKLVDPTN